MTYFIFFVKILIMKKEDFTELLKKHGLKKKQFADLSGENYHTVLGWGREYTDNGLTKTIAIPNWIDSWLNNYEKAKKYEIIINALNEYSK